MPRVRKRIRDTEKKEIEPVLTSVSPEDAINLHKTNDIRHILETLIGESVSKTLISDIFNMLFLPVPMLRKDYPKEDDDHYQAMQSLLSELSKIELREKTVSSVENSTASAVKIIADLINSMKQMDKNGSSGQNQEETSTPLLDKWLDGKNGKADQLKQMLQQSTPGNAESDTDSWHQYQINEAARKAARSAEQSGEGLDELMGRMESQGHAQEKHVEYV